MSYGRCDDVISKGRDYEVVRGHFVRVTEESGNLHSSNHESNGICTRCGKRIVRYDCNEGVVELEIVDGQIINRSVNGK
jgi:hypothetical protein